MEYTYQPMRYKKISNLLQSYTSSWFKKSSNHYNNKIDNVDILQFNSNNA